MMKRYSAIKWIALTLLTILFFFAGDAVFAKKKPKPDSFPPSQPILILPANGSNDDGTFIIFQWFAAADATWYRIQIADNPFFTASSIYVNWYQEATTIFSWSGLPDNGLTWYWRVAGWNPTWGDGPWSATWWVTNGPSAPPDTPQLISPADGVIENGTEIFFSWNNTPRAVDFFLEVAYDPGFTTVVFDKWIGWNNSIILTNFPDNGQVVYWHVIAWNSKDFSPWSTVRSVINGPTSGPAQPMLISPADGAKVNGDEILFRWNPADRALNYLIEFADDASFTTNYFNFLLDYWETQILLFALPDNGLEIYWRVLAQNSKGENVSITRSVINGPSALPDIPTLVSPVDGVNVRGTDVHFEWDDTPRALDHYIQIARDPLFLDIFYQAWLGYPYPYADVPGFFDDNQRYYWRVKAKNPLGESPGYSLPWSFYNGPCAPQIGLGLGLLSPRNHIDTCFDSSTSIYSLQDISRQATSPGNHGHSGMMPAGASIDTTLYPAGPNQLMTDSDNTWDLANQYSGVDAHVHTGQAYDHFNLSMGLNSFDGLGSTMTTRVEVITSSAATPNAFWFNPDTRVSFTTQVGPFLPFSAALDVVAHEWGHAITDRASARPVVTDPYFPGVLTAGLFYSFESGALNEAYSDWLGTAVEHWHGEINWTMGEGSLVLRDLQDPSSSLLASVLLADGQVHDLRQPDTYNGLFYLSYNQGNCTPDPNLNDNCGVHTNSGVPNKMFFLLTAGGTHNVVDVQGVGIQAAMAIGHTANMVYWAHNATFQDALAGMEAAAAQLYPADPNFVNQVKNAWAAVGIGTIPLISASASPAMGGTVAGAGSYSWGASATVTATDNPGYRFVNWTENAIEVSIDPSYTFQVNGNRSLVANFALVDPTISIIPTSHDFGNYYVGETSPPQTFTISNVGEEALVIATVVVIGNDYSDFTMIDNCSGLALALNETCNVQINFSPLSAGTKQAKISIPSNDPATPFLEVPLTGMAADQPIFTITASAEPGGSISPFGSVEIDLNGSQTFTISADTGFSILDVEVDGASAIGQVTFTIPDVEATYLFENVDADHTIRATFSLNSYTVTATAGPGGSIFPTGAIEVLFAGSQAFTIAADPGYSIVDLKVDEVSVLDQIIYTVPDLEATYTLADVRADQTIAATFSLNTYTITASAGGGGSIAPSGSVIVGHGSSQTFTITPNGGNGIADVRVDGASVGADPEYPFTNVTEDHTIAAFFTSTLTVQKSGPGLGRVTSSPAGINCGTDCDEAYAYGTIVTLTATGGPGGVFFGWSGGGVQCSDLPTCTVTMNTSRTITAIFDEVMDPVTTATPTGGSYNTALTVTLTCNDIGSGCDRIYYTTNGVTPTTSSSVYSAPIIITTTTTLKYFATDFSGNDEEVKTQIYTLPPVSGVTLAASPISPQLFGTTVTFSAAGSGGSGVYEYRFLLKPGASTSWQVVQNYSAGDTWTWNTCGFAPGAYDVQVRVRNVGSTAILEASGLANYVMENTYLAEGELTTTGRVSSGNYTSTWSSDNQRELLQEGGNKHQLLHVWQFTGIPAGSSQTLYVEGSRPNNVDGDNFKILHKWSADCSGKRFQVSGITIDSGSESIKSAPVGNSSGSLCVAVDDSAGGGNDDYVSIDRVYVVVEDPVCPE